VFAGSLRQKVNIPWRLSTSIAVQDLISSIFGLRVLLFVLLAARVLMTVLTH